MNSESDIKLFDQIVSENKHLTGTVLIVDDNEDIVEITKINLEKYTKFKVITAGNGHEALAILANQAVDVIVLDDRMPAMSGPEFFAIIRQRSIHVPVIFLTGTGTETARQQQLALGAFDYVQKPVKAKDLIILVIEAYKVMSRIRDILERKA